ncbi:MAG: hypothetical protein B7C24_04490 [Bacteroidetes bacterium 4572_77]|nr:MAG: hypothetical protein B7C24_04490 [Bacteroidetes bacterium 4572_77]
MRKKNIYLSIILSFIGLSIMAQTAEDALRFSENSSLGTARFIGLSGAMGSIGGDLSSINYNPAGLGIYKSSEYVWAPRYLYVKNKANYNGNSSTETRDNLNFGLAGLVSTIPVFGKSGIAGWKYMQFGLTVNRVNNYRSDIYIEGDSYGGSRVFDWRDQANGHYPNDLNLFGSNLAWETYLLDTLNGYSNQYQTAVPSEGVYQTYSKQSQGYKNEMSFAFSGNYNDKFFIGTSLNFSFLRYSSSIYTTEEALFQPKVYEFNNFSYREELLTKANGFNAKVGVIYMITPAIRISGAFHTPTWYYDMTDDYYSKINSTMSNGEKYTKTSPNGRYDYKLYTPLRAMGGASFFFSNLGFLSIDYEYMDYSQAQFKSSESSLNEANQQISQDFVATHNLRIGAEVRLQSLFLRGGYGIGTSPVNSDINDLLQSQWSVGFGYRSGPFFMNFAFMQQLQSQNYYMYNAEYVNPAYLETNKNTFSASLGFKF